MIILTLTINPALDVSTHISGMVPEKKLRCTAPDYFPGGGGVNVSRALNRLGLDNLAMFVSGGPAGELIAKLLKKENVTASPVEVETWTRENLTVLDDASGNQYRFTFPGLPLPAKDWEVVLKNMEKLSPFPEMVVMSGSFAPGFPLEFIGKVKAICDKYKAKLLIDTSGPYLQEAAKVGVYLIKPNYNELCYMAGVKPDQLLDVQVVARKVIEQGGCEVMVVSLGANGASLVTATEYVHIHAPKVPIKSTVGAGDSLLAGVAYALAKNLSWKEVLRWGVACGSATTMNEGTGLFQPEQVEQMRKLIR
jgi:6-phosphofructokinase 2